VPHCCCTASGRRLHTVAAVLPVNWWTFKLRASVSYDVQLLLPLPYTFFTSCTMSCTAVDGNLQSLPAHDASDRGTKQI
jgi:hypothetical protein